MASEREVDWGADESAFPESEIEEWEFFVSPSNPATGQGDGFQFRIDADVARRADEAIQVCKERGIPIKTRSDFGRFAISKILRDLQSYLKIKDEGFNHFLIRQREAQRVAQQTEELTRIKKVAGDIISGVRLLVSKEHKEYREARTRISAFLSPIMGLVGTNDLLVKMYIRSVFASKMFQASLKVIEDEVGLDSTIKNAQKAYGRFERE